MQLYRFTEFHFLQLINLISFIINSSSSPFPPKFFLKWCDEDEDDSFENVGNDDVHKDDDSNDDDGNEDDGFMMIISYC